MAYGNYCMARRSSVAKGWLGYCMVMSFMLYALHDQSERRSAGQTDPASTTNSLHHLACSCPGNVSLHLFSNASIIASATFGVAALLISSYTGFLNRYSTNKLTFVISFISVASLPSISAACISCPPAGAGLCGYPPTVHRVRRYASGPSCVSASCSLFCASMS